MPILANYSLVKSNLNGYRANEGSQHFNSHSMVSQLLAIYRRIRWSNKKEGGGGGSNIVRTSNRFPLSIPFFIANTSFPGIAVIRWFCAARLINLKLYKQADVTRDSMKSTSDICLWQTDLYRYVFSHSRRNQQFLLLLNLKRSSFTKAGNALQPADWSGAKCTGRLRDLHIAIYYLWGAATE